MNGGTLAVGADINFSVFNLAGLIGVTGVNCIGEFSGGPSFTGKLKVPITDHVQFLGIGLYSQIDHLRIEDTDASGEVIGGQTGVVNASYFGVGVLLR
jgi:hypothetical protein